MKIETLKIKGMFVLLSFIGVLLFPGCAEDSKDNQLRMSELENEVEVQSNISLEQAKLIDDLNNANLLQMKQIENLNKTIADKEEEINKLIGPVESKTDMESDYIFWLNSVGTWDVIRIADIYGNKIEVTNSEYLKAFSQIFRINQDISNSIQKGDAEFSPPKYMFELIKNDKLIKLTVTDNNIVIIDEKETPNAYLGIGIYQLGEALLPKPSFYPSQDMMNKLLYSEMMIQEIDAYTFYRMDVGVDMVLSAFFQAKREKISQPNDLGALVGTLRFFNEGKEIDMMLFSDYIEIKSADEVEYYRLKQEDILNLVYILNGN